MSMKKKVICVTGAQGHLGSAVIRRYLAAGHNVIGLDLLIKSQNSLEQDPKNPNLKWLRMDLTKTDSVASGFELLRRNSYETEVLVHCAGGFRFNYLEKTTDEELEFMLNVNLRSSFLIAREILPEMRKRNSGRLVFISSKSTLQPPAGMTAYAASKAGLNALVTALAEEVKGTQINVNAVLPSIIDTPANRKSMSKSDFSQWVTCEQLAEIIFALTQDLGKPIHGALIPVTGRV